MTDRLSEIEQRARQHWEGSTARADFEWLIAEVKRLRLALEMEHRLLCPTCNPDASST